MAPFFELLYINLIQLVRRLDLKTYWALTPQMAMPQNANPFLERSHVAAFSRCAGSSIQHRWSTIAFRPLVVVMTCARSAIENVRKSQQTSCITHKVFIAVEVCIHLPCLFTQDFLLMFDLHNLRFPKRSTTHCLRLLCDS